MIRRSASYAQHHSVHQNHYVMRVRRVVKWWVDLTVGCHTQHAEIGNARQAQGSLQDEMTRVVLFSFPLSNVSHSRHITTSRNCK